MSSSSESLPRIIGTETEYNPVIKRYDTEKPDLLSKDDFISVPDNVDIHKQFTTNGARFYVDFHELPEYATPECGTIAEAVHAEIAGEKFMLHALRKYVIERPLIEKASLHKRVATDFFYTDPANGLNDKKHIVSWGYHENYLIERTDFFNTHTRNFVMAHLASRALLVGAGYWRPNKEDPLRMLPAQKLLDIEEETSASTTTRKPLLNLRDEEHTGAVDLARLHITSGDANISPWSTWLKLGSTSLVLRLVETGTHHVSVDHLPMNMLGTAMQVAHKGNEALITLRNNKHVHPIDIHEELAEACRLMSEEVNVPKEELIVLEEWGRAIDDFRRDPTLLQDRTEWIARRQWLNQAHDKLRNKDNLLSKLATADKMWDNMPMEDADNKKLGIGFRKRDAMAFPGYDPTEAEWLVDHPPSHTRAAERSSLIRAMIHNQLTYDTNARCDWEVVSGIKLDDPRGNNFREMAS